MRTTMKNLMLTGLLGWCGVACGADDLRRAAGKGRSHGPGGFGQGAGEDGD